MTLKEYADCLGIVLRRVAEIATGWPENSYMTEFAEAGVPTVLVEPQREMFDKVVARFGTFPNVTCLQKLITPDGLYRRMIRPVYEDARGAAQAAFLEDVYSPARHMTDGMTICVPRPDWCHGADTCTTSMIDDGDWDVLNLDAEGSEWLVLSTMVSRPRLIHVEVFGAYGYVNPDIEKIERWAEAEGYHVAENPGLKDPGQNRIFVR